MQIIFIQYFFVLKHTFPVRETSPVMASFPLIGWLRANERRAVMMVHPAEGPSLGVAPAGI